MIWLTYQQEIFSSVSLLFLFTTDYTIFAYASFYLVIHNTCAMASSCSPVSESVKCLSRISRVLLLVLVILAGAGGIATAKGDSTKPSNVTSVAATATANPAKGDGKGVLKEDGLTGKGKT
ncbi:MAG: hypothetical protein WCL46_10615, partial [Chlorobium sp.]